MRYQLSTFRESGQENLFFNMAPILKGVTIFVPATILHLADKPAPKGWERSWEGESTVAHLYCDVLPSDPKSKARHLEKVGVYYTSLWKI